MLVDPAGNLLARASQKREVRITNPKLANVAAMADEAFRLLHLTVVCPHCGGTPVCNNAATDANWRMECSCTKRLLVNPNPSPTRS